MKNFHICNIFFKYLINAYINALVIEKSGQKILISIKPRLPNLISLAPLNKLKSNI